MLLTNIELNAFEKIVESECEISKKTFLSRLAGALDLSKSYSRELIAALNSVVFYRIFKDPSGEVIAE